MEDDEQIDFHKLEKEFAFAVEADAKYQRENAAKFRAVEQRVGSYEEFKDIVAASHLKPLEKKDRLGQEKPKQPWNSLATAQSKREKTISTSIVSSRSSQQLLTSQNLTKTWKNELKTPSDKYRYLCKTGGKTLGQILKCEIPMGLFSAFVEVLNSCFCQHDHNTIIDILWHLSNTNRFGLTVDFLSSKEKLGVNELFAKIRRCLDEDSNTTEHHNKFQELLGLCKVNL